MKKRAGILVTFIVILLSGCGFTSDETDVEYVEETGFVKELDESKTLILVNIHDEFEDEERLTWFEVSEEKFQEIVIEDKVSVTYNKRQAQILSKTPVYDEVKTVKKIE